MKKGRARKLLLGLLFLVGAGITFYPLASKMWNRYRDQRLLSAYEETVDGLRDDAADSILEEAVRYNEQHTANTLTDAFGGADGRSVPAQAADADEDQSDARKAPLQEDLQDYEALLNPLGNGIMGTLQIPGINAALPIYHGTGDDVLERGIGHIRGTSLPVGGKSTHTVLAGHRGLPERKLLTDLDQVEMGDRFYILVLREKLAYEVDDIRVVEPHETESLMIESGQDLATIVTCTPYGVNSHRLLVRGHRVPFSEADTLKVREAEDGWSLGLEERALAAGLAAFAGFLLLLFLFRRRKRG